MEGGSCSIFKTLFHYFLVGNEENHEESQDSRLPGQ
jgi:hypothetical protein